MIVIEPSRSLFRLDLEGLWSYRELLYFLVWRDVKVRYKQTLLGMLWALVNPLFSVFVFTVVFGMLARIPSDGLPYPVFAFAGLLPWNYFSHALGRAAGSLVGSAPLLTKVYFPRLLIPTAATITPSVDLFFSCLTMFGLMAWYGIAPGWAVVLLPLFTLFAMVTALAIGMWLAPVNVRFHDVGYIVPFLVQSWMYVSPVVYPVSLVPEQWRLLYSLNPLVTIIEGFRWALVGGQPPDPRGMLVGVFGVLVLFVAGAVFFKRMERTVADVV